MTLAHSASQISGMFFLSMLYYKTINDHLLYIINSCGSSNLNYAYTMEARYNKPLSNKVLGITNDFLYPSNSKIYEKEHGYTETLVW